MQNYILKVDALGLKKGAVAQKDGVFYTIYDYKGMNAININSEYVENSEFFEKEEEKVWNKDWEPKNNEKYYFADGRGYVEETWYIATLEDEYRVKNSTCFKTKHEAEMWKKFLEALSVKQTAVRGEDFYIYYFSKKRTQWIEGAIYDYYSEIKKFKTQKEAQEYGEKYYDCILFFNK